jgi:hypothetical protein
MYALRKQHTDDAKAMMDVISGMLREKCVPTLCAAVRHKALPSDADMVFII